jgi:hypothetical protein
MECLYAHNAIFDDPHVMPAFEFSPIISTEVFHDCLSILQIGSGGVCDVVCGTFLRELMARHRPMLL